MSKHHFSLLIGLIGQAGCLVYDDSRLRPPVDAALENTHDVVTPLSDASRDALRDTTRDTALEYDDVTNDGAAASDAGSDRAVADASEGDVGVGPDRDAPEIPPVEDAAADAPVDRAIDRDGRVDDPDVNIIVDAGVDNITVGCQVGFTVSNVSWATDSAPSDAGWDGGEASVRLVGNLASMGAWEPTKGAAMTLAAPGTWFVALNLDDAIDVQFKFVKLSPGYTPEWESWTPFDSNRALRVDCLAEGGSVYADGGPAVGRSYGGAFGVRPVDATK